MTLAATLFVCPPTLRLALAAAAVALAALLLGAGPAAAHGGHDAARRAASIESAAALSGAKPNQVDAAQAFDPACCHAQTGPHCAPLWLPPAAETPRRGRRARIARAQGCETRALAAPRPGVPPPIRAVA